MDTPFLRTYVGPVRLSNQGKAPPFRAAPEHRRAEPSAAPGSSLEDYLWITMLPPLIVWGSARSMSSVHPVHPIRLS